MNCPACHEIVPSDQSLDYHLAGCDAALCPKCGLNLENCRRMLHGDPDDVTMAIRLLEAHGKSCADSDALLLLINGGYAAREYARKRLEQTVDGPPVMAVRQN